MKKFLTALALLACTGFAAASDVKPTPPIWLRRFNCSTR